MIGLNFYDSTPNDTMKNLLTVPVSYLKLRGGKLIVTIFLSLLFGVYSVTITFLTGTLTGLDGFSADVLLRQGVQVVAAAFNTGLVCMPMILIFGQMWGAYLGGSLLTFFLGYCILFFKSGFLLSAYPFSAALIHMQAYNGATQAPGVLLALAGMAEVLVLTMVILLPSRPSKKASNSKKEKNQKRAWQTLRLIYHFVIDFKVDVDIVCNLIAAITVSQRNFGHCKISLGEAHAFGVDPNQYPRDLGQTNIISISAGTQKAQGAEDGRMSPTRKPSAEAHYLSGRSFGIIQQADIKIPHCGS